MRNLKRVMALMLSLVLVLSLNVTAFAYGDSGGDTRSVTITADDDSWDALLAFMDAVRAFVNTDEGKSAINTYGFNGVLLGTMEELTGVAGDESDAADTSATFTPADGSEASTGSLADMVALAAETDGVITLNQSVELTETLVIPEDADVTIDMNGYNISRVFNAEAPAREGVIEVYANGDWTALTGKFTMTLDAGYEGAPAYDKFRVMNVSEGEITVPVFKGNDEFAVTYQGIDEDADELTLAAGESVEFVVSVAEGLAAGDYRFDLGTRIGVYAYALNFELTVQAVADNQPGESETPDVGEPETPDAEDPNGDEDYEPEFPVVGGTYMCGGNCNEHGGCNEFNLCEDCDDEGHCGLMFDGEPVEGACAGCIINSAIVPPHGEDECDEVRESIEAAQVVSYIVEMPEYAVDDGHVIETQGKLTLISSADVSGVISGGASLTTGGGIVVDSTGELIAENVIITRNIAAVGGGIYADGPVTLTDVSVINNTATEAAGGINVTNTLTVSGRTIIANNEANAENSNVYLADDGRIVIGGPLDESAYIGITTADKPEDGKSIEILGEGEYEFTAADLNKFMSDNALYYIDLENGSLSLERTQTYIATVYYVTDDETPVAIATAYQTDELTSLTYDLNEAIPETIQYDGHNYQLVDIDGYTDGVIDEDCTVTCVYSIDDIGNELDMRKPDGIADKYQVSVEFKAVNGTLDFYLLVLTRRDAYGELDLEAVPALTAVPVATANEGYGDGKWDVTPEIGMAINEDTVFTVTFTEAADGGDVVEPDGEAPASWLSLIDREHHYSYIVGYGNGKFGPNDKITRAQMATILYRLLTEDAVNEYEKNAASFKDVPDGAWYEKAVATIANIGIVTGYDDETFKPEANVTRAEFVAMLVRVLGEDVEGDLDEVLDGTAADQNTVDAETGENAEATVGDGTAADNNTVVDENAVGDGTAEDKNEVEADADAAEAGDDGLNATPKALVEDAREEGKHAFSDVSEKVWYAKYIETAYGLGWVNGYGDGTFAPDQTLTRAEAVVIINRVLGRAATEGNLLPSLKGFDDVSENAWYYYDILEAANSHTFVLSEKTGYEIWRRLL